jgi:hypothetical protein
VPDMVADANKMTTRADGTLDTSFFDQNTYSSVTIDRNNYIGGVNINSTFNSNGPVKNPPFTRNDAEYNAIKYNAVRTNTWRAAGWNENVPTHANGVVHDGIVSLHHRDVPPTVQATMIRGHDTTL